MYVPRIPTEVCMDIVDLVAGLSTVVGEIRGNVTPT